MLVNIRPTTRPTQIFFRAVRCYSTGPENLKKVLGVGRFWKDNKYKPPKEEQTFSKDQDNELGNLVKRLFKPNQNATSSFTRYYRQRQMSNVLNGRDKLISDEPVEELPEMLEKPLDKAIKQDLQLGANLSYWRNSSKFDRQLFLKTAREATPILYWNSLDMTFDPSDFIRLLPPPEMWVGSYENVEDIDLDFSVIRSRNPVDLSRWLGYYLEFKSEKAAALYVNETRGAQLCGLEVKFKFVTKEKAPGLISPYLQKAQGVTRRMCALAFGIPFEMTNNRILRILWDYELIDDDHLAIERLPKGSVRYSASPVLLRFKSEEEAQRFVREFHGKVWPHTESEVLAEVVD